jgi:hypothetical protein
LRSKVIVCPDDDLFMLVEVFLVACTDKTITH